MSNITPQTDMQANTLSTRREWGEISGNNVINTFCEQFPNNRNWTTTILPIRTLAIQK